MGRLLSADECVHVPFQVCSVKSVGGGPSAHFRISPQSQASQKLFRRAPKIIGPRRVAYTCIPGRTKRTPCLRNLHLGPLGVEFPLPIRRACREFKPAIGPMLVSQNRPSSIRKRPPPSCSSILAGFRHYRGTFKHVCDRVFYQKEEITRCIKTWVKGK